MRRNPPMRQFLKPAFIVNAVLSLFALVIAVRSCGETAKSRRIEEVRLERELDEELSVTGYVRWITNRPFTYIALSSTSDSALSFVPSIADFAITNNSAHPVTIQSVNYAQFGCVGDSICLPCVTDRNGPTKRKYRPPIDLSPGETVRLEDTVHICVPGRQKPYICIGADSLYWMRIPLEGQLHMMTESVQKYAPLFFGDGCFKPSEAHLRVDMRTSRGNIHSYQYYLWTDSLGVVTVRRTAGNRG